MFAAFPMPNEWEQEWLMFLHSLIGQGKGCKDVLSDTKRPVFYVETTIIPQKQTVLTHLAWERLQICAFWHEKAGVICRNQTWHKILKIFEKSKFWTYWYWFWYWKLQFQNIDFDIDIEICISKILILILILNFLGILILILVLILKKEEENIDNLSSEKNTSASLTLGF